MADMTDVVFWRSGTQDLEAQPIIDGQLLYDTDTGKIYMDNGSERKELSKQEAVTLKPLNFTGAVTETYDGTAEKTINIPQGGSGGSGVGQNGTGKNAEIFNSYEDGMEKNVASGQYSHAEGRSTEATKEEAHAEGWNTHATGIQSHAEGAKSVAKGYYSHAEGYSTLANGSSTHAEGEHTEVTGFGAHAEGISTNVGGSGGHAEGSNLNKNGVDPLPNYSVTGGGWVRGPLAKGVSSHAEGVQTAALEYASHSEGIGTVANTEAQHVEGKFNKYADEAGYYTHVVGNGRDDKNRSNAYTLDGNGNAWFAGRIRTGGTGYYDPNAMDVTTTDTPLKVVFDDGSAGLTADKTYEEVFEKFNYGNFVYGTYNRKRLVAVDYKPGLLEKSSIIFHTAYGITPAFKILLSSDGTVTLEQ